MPKTSLVVTTISEPNSPLRTLDKGCKLNDIEFYIIGDTKSPVNFDLNGCQYYSSENSKSLKLETSKLSLDCNYARKNIGYALSIKNGSEIIIETDDDNSPYGTFWNERPQKTNMPVAQYTNNWFNVYKMFTDKRIWPRGLPLDCIDIPVDSTLLFLDVNSPIQQGLADFNPDVDAIYRLTSVNESFSFHPPKRWEVALGPRTWCPFNSQNTIWFKDAFPLLYLPSYCSFRMCDIWRSFIAQRICWENDWQVSYFAPTVYQKRNHHDLLDDFKQEIVGYLNNKYIGEILNDLPLLKGKENIVRNMYKCYELMIDKGFICPDELFLLDAWFADIQ